MKQEINDFVNGVIESHHLVGVAVGVVWQSQPWIEAGYGVRSLGRIETITPDSLFHLASISKLFVATSVMQLVQQGKITLKDPLEIHLPYLKVNNPFETKITIRHLLSHTSGFPDVTDYGWEKPENDDGALERYVRSLDIGLLFEPGQRFFYSNMAYEVLGHLIARVSGFSFEEYVRENILVPLQMLTSTHFKKEVPASLAVDPHVADLTTHVSDLYPYNRDHSPSSTLHSSAREMNHWAMANLNRGHLHDAVILPSAVYDEMWQPQMAVGNPDQPDKFAGLGWFMDRRNDVPFVYHSGQDVGFSTYLLLVPEQSMGIAILCNTSPAPVEELAFGIMDILLGREPAPLKPSVMTLLGSVYAEKGLDAMKQSYEELVSSNPQELDLGIGGFLEVSSSLLDRNENAQAIDILTFTLDRFQNSAAANELMARACFQTGNFEKALSYAKRSLEIQPDNEFLRQQIKPLL